MPYLSWNDIERIASDVVRDYKHYFVPERRMCYSIEPDLLAQMLGLKIEYGFLSDDGSVYGLTSPEEVCITTFDEKMNEEMYFLDGRTIMVDERLRRAPKLKGCLNFTKGHEVCHHILGRMYPGEYGVYHRVHCLYRKKGESRQEITDWGEWQADALTSAILMPKEALEEAMFMFSLGEKMKVLSRKYSQNKYEQFCEMADFLGVSRTSLSFRMEKLGLLERNYLIQEAQARKGAAS